MKSYLSVLLLLSTATSFAQGRLDECPRPGIIQSKMASPSGEEMSNRHDRSGSLNLDNTFSVRGSIRTRIYNNYVDRVCVAKTYTETQRVCGPVSPDLALGRGNALLKGIYNLGESAYRRAEVLTQNLKFAEARLPAEKLDAALHIVSQLSRIATTSGLPKTFDELKAHIDQAMKEGYLTYHVAEELTVIYRAHNENALGFRPLPGVEVRQGNGNGRLNTLFDFNLPPQTRALRLQQLIMGVSPVEAPALSSSFISFASMNGIPASWDQFVVMMRNAVTTAVVAEHTYQAVVHQYEEANRRALGFELSAEICRTQNINRIQHVVEVHNRQELLRTITKPYEINISSAPLLAGEKESMVLTTNGLRDLDLRISSEYNRYQVKGTEVGGVLKFSVVGLRLAVRPPNTLRVKFNKIGDVLNVRIQNNGHNAKIGGKVIVKVRYINGGFLDDDTLGTESYELDGPAELIKTAGFRHRKVDFVKVSMQIVGSPYYSGDFSGEVKAKD